MEKSELLRKASKAAKRYLELHDWQHLGTCNNFEIWLDDDGAAVFTNTTASIDEWKESDPDVLRSDFEEAMVQWLKDNDDLVDVYIRCDELQFRVFSDNRALIRHKVNAVGIL